MNPSNAFHVSKDTRKALEGAGRLGAGRLCAGRLGAVLIKNRHSASVSGINEKIIV